MDDLVREEDNSIRYCDSNIVKLGYWWLAFKMFDEFAYDLSEALKHLFDGILALLFLMLLPISPFIKAYFRLRQAKKEVEYYQQHFGENND